MVDQLQEVIVLFEEIKETFETQDSMLDLVKVVTPEEAKLQNGDNTVWYPVEQQRAVQKVWDTSSTEQDIIKEGFPCSLDSAPDTDVVTQRIDDLRNDIFMKEAIVASGKKLTSNLNSSIAAKIKAEGSLFIRATDTSGFDFATRAQALMDERQLAETERYFLMNPTDARTFGSELAGRETITGRSEDAWKKGYIAADVAGFDIMKGNFLPNITGGASPDTTVTGAQSFEPEGYKSSVNVDYRTATVVVVASANYAVGDKVTFENAGTPVYALGKDDKTVTTSPMSFTVKSKPSGTTLEIYPKPIALDDAALTTLQKGYANIDTQIGNAAVVVRQNVDASNQTNLFWDKSAVQVMGGSFPIEKFKEGGNRVVGDTLSNGLEMYLVYFVNPSASTVSYKIYLWYGITIGNPANCGVAVTYSA